MSLVCIIFSIFFCVLEKCFAQLDNKDLYFINRNIENNEEKRGKIDKILLNENYTSNPVNELLFTMSDSQTKFEKFDKNVTKQFEINNNDIYYDYNLILPKYDDINFIQLKVLKLFGHYPGKVEFLLSALRVIWLN